MRLSLLIFALFFLNFSGFSQLKEKNSLIGPSIGFWTSSSVPTLGANYETQLSQLGNTGTISLGGIVRYTSYNEKFTSGSYVSEADYSYIILGLQSNFNFNKIGDGKFVPYAGLVLGYNIVNSSFKNNQGTNISASATSGFWIWGQAGLRYFFSKNIAGVVRLGAGNYSFTVAELGLDFKF